MGTRGMSQIEIASELQVSEASISSDIAYLRNQAKENIREYTTEHLPEQYQVCLCALDTILKHAFEILQTTDDNREVACNGTIQGYPSSQTRVTVQRYDHR
jgi:hypothetical protein